MTSLVVDASAGVELALKTPIGLRLDAKIPGSTTIWVQRELATFLQLVEEAKSKTKRRKNLGEEGSEPGLIVSPVIVRHRIENLPLWSGEGWSDG